MIYLLHFERPYRHARHYLGYAVDVEMRIHDHRRGNGARLTQVITQAGIGMILVRTWDGDRNDERKLKRHNNAPRMCPICNPRRWITRGNPKETNVGTPNDV